MIIKIKVVTSTLGSANLQQSKCISSPHTLLRLLVHSDAVALVPGCWYCQELSTKFKSFRHQSSEPPQGHCHLSDRHTSQSSWCRIKDSAATGTPCSGAERLRVVRCGHNSATFPCGLEQKAPKSLFFFCDLAKWLHVWLW